jgi:hypothetical protein
MGKEGDKALGELECIIVAWPDEEQRLVTQRLAEESRQRRQGRLPFKAFVHRAPRAQRSRLR